MRTSIRHSRIFWAELAGFLTLLAVSVGALAWASAQGAWILASCAVLILALAGVVVAWLVRRMVQPISELTAALRALESGATAKRIAIAGRGEIAALAAAFNDMSQACAERIALLDQDRRQLRTMLESMVEGVLVIDADQRIQFVNEAAGRFLDLDQEACLGRKLWEMVRHRRLAETVDRIFASEQSQHLELEWGLSERHILAVHGARLPGPALSGAVLVFHDISHLRKLERIRQDFVANVSHELKTPLAAIQATVETLLDGAIRDPEHNVRFLERVRENADRLYRLVQDLLTLGRIETGQESLDVEPLPLQASIEACISRQADRAKAKGLALESDPPAEPVVALADDEALAEILDNLVDNAIKYSPPGGRISLHWFADDDEAVVQVEDTGVGIPQKDLPRIFERFYRVDKARSRELGGTGLGLSIVKHLVQNLGGSISAESQVGQGTTFTVRLPRVAYSHQAAQL